MTTTVVFVHGGGVRAADFVLTFRFLQQMFLGQGITHTLAPCFWGDEQGSRRPVLCIPKAEKNGGCPKSLTEEQKVARWDLLYRDPVSELRLLKSRTNVQRRPSQPQGLGLWTLIESYNPSLRLKDFLDKWQMTPYWDRAWRSIIGDDETAKDVLLVSGQDVAEPAESIGRGLVARLTALAQADNLPALDGDHRDELVSLLITDWFGRDGGVNLHVGRLLADIRTPAEPGRGRPADATSAALGDVLLYQARGTAIRRSIQRAIVMATDANGNSETPRIVLLAHSLGGIACVDLLAKEAPPHVTHLITVGSQAPYLYEIGALHGLDVAKREKLPSTFPPWLNLYDPNDFLSYVAEPVFQTTNIRDARIESGQPFPESHGAYWTNDATWRAIKEFVM
jgi:hypothetical protein